MGILGRTVGDRLQGNRPSAPRAALAAVVAGAAAAALTYKALRA
ncbi:MAG TPA: hypothetical protein VKV21_13275 [Solirubrobacteraceae bacterium]|nr:hypothetical protein [Solirubrobacteraceae bacterium]